MCVCVCVCVCVFCTQGMAGLIDKILASSLPSYDLSIGVGLVFNSSDVGEDESIFMTSRLKTAQYARDQKKIDTVWIHN